MKCIAQIRRAKVKMPKEPAVKRSTEQDWDR
jgi:hypothetical protein